MNRGSSAVLLVVFSGAAVAQRPQGDPRILADRLSGEFMTAMRNRDIGWFRRTAAPEFVYVDKAGRRSNKKESVAGVEMGMKTMRIVSFSRRIRSAAWTPTGLKFIAEYTLRSVMTGGKNPKPVRETLRTETTAIRRDGRWLWTSVREL